MLRAPALLAIALAVACVLFMALHVSPALAQADPLALAEQAAAAGDFAAARRHLAEAAGSEATLVPGAELPVASQALLIVTTTPTERTCELQLIPYGDPDRLTGLLLDAARALAGAGRVQPGAASLTLVLRVTDGEPPANLRNAAAALPERAELGLLSAALATGTIFYDKQMLPFGIQEQYREEVDMGLAADRCEELAVTLDTASKDGRGADERVAAVQRKIWAADAAAWRKFCARSRALYRVQLESARAERQWEIPAGGSRVLETSAMRWRSDRLAWAAGAALLLIVVFVAALWRVS